MNSVFLMYDAALCSLRKSSKSPNPYVPHPLVCPRPTAGARRGPEGSRGPRRRPNLQNAPTPGGGEKNSKINPPFGGGGEKK